MPEREPRTVEARRVFVRRMGLRGQGEHCSSRAGSFTRYQGSARFLTCGAGGFYNQSGWYRGSSLSSLVDGSFFYL